MTSPAIEDVPKAPVATEPEPDPTINLEKPTTPSKKSQPVKVTQKKSKLTCKSAKTATIEIKNLFKFSNLAEKPKKTYVLSVPKNLDYSITDAGQLVISKGNKPGTYTIKIRIKFAATEHYKAKTVTTTLKIKI